MSNLREVVTCPKCGGSGTLCITHHDHEWRLVESIGGSDFNLQVYACQYEDCEAALCSDCASEGREVCA